MSIVQIIAVILVSAVGLQAQGSGQTTPPEAAVAAAVASLGQYQTAQRLSQILRTLQTNLKVSENVKAEVDKLAAEAAPLQSAGNTSEARRILLHAIAVQRGLPWNEKTAFSASLRLQTNAVVTDSSRMFYGRLTQSYAAPSPYSDGLRLHVTVADFAAPGKVVRDLGTFSVFARDLLDAPFNFSAALEGLPDGPYQLAAEVAHETELLGRLTTNILTVGDFEGQRAAIEARLAKIKGFEGTKATIRYPFDYARVINLGSRDLIPGRNPEDNANNDYFDFSAEVHNSLTLLKSPESGKDPLFRIKGERERHYYFADAGEIMPYRVFVPSKYTEKTKLPLVVVLHGSGADQDTYFKRRGPVLTTEAEKHGFIIVTPLGYRPTGGWGRTGAPVAAPGGAGRRGGAPGAEAGAPAPADRGRQVTSELSEKDALNLIELVANEYGVDRSRMYLMGNSMGGAGTWYLGTKFAERWAAIAPCAATSVGEGFPLDRLKGLPVIYTNGDQDMTVSVDGARRMIQWLKERGYDIPYTEVKGGTHDMAIWQNLPQIFDFFEKYRRQ
jgi:poly(3-hydroxybutyrate) depolymerase